MGKLQAVLIVALLGSALPHAGALAIDPPPRVGAVRDASRSEPAQPQPKADTAASERAQQKEADKDKDPDAHNDAGPAKAAPVDEPKPDAKPDAKTDAKGQPIKPAEPPAARKKPVKRRAVSAQLDDGMNPPVYRPRLAPVVPMPSLPTPSSAVPSGPVILNGCPGGHCTDRAGQRYNPVGTTLISPQGRLCNNNGISVSCY